MKSIWYFKISMFMFWRDPISLVKCILHHFLSLRLLLSYSLLSYHLKYYILLWISNCIHVVQVSLFHSFFFFFVAQQYSIAYVYHILIHSSFNRHLDCFHILAIVNCPTMNLRVHVSFCIMVFLWIYAQE